MKIVFAAFHFPGDRRFVMLAGGPIQAPISAACAVGHGSHRQPALTLLIHRSHHLFGNRLAVSGRWLGTFGSVELEDGVGLALIGAGYDSVLLVFTTVHGLRSGHGRLASKPAAYSSKLSY